MERQVDKKEIKLGIIGGVLGLLTFLIGVWLSGWQFERGVNAVFVFVFLLMFVVIGALLSIMAKTKQ
jgi:hypothetical protein